MEAGENSTANRGIGYSVSWTHSCKELEGQTITVDRRLVKPFMEAVQVYTEDETKGVYLYNDAIDMLKNKWRKRGEDRWLITD